MKIPSGVFSLRTALIVAIAMVTLYVLALNGKDPLTLAAQNRRVAA